MNQFSGCRAQNAQFLRDISVWIYIILVKWKLMYREKQAVQEFKKMFDSISYFIYVERKGSRELR